MTAYNDLDKLEETIMGDLYNAKDIVDSFLKDIEVLEIELPNDSEELYDARDIVHYMVNDRYATLINIVEAAVDRIEYNLMYDEVTDSSEDTNLYYEHQTIQEDLEAYCSSLKGARYWKY